MRLIGEITDNNIPRPSRDWRPNPTSYYVHGGNTNYTNGGAILGSAIGPGGSTQYLGVDVLTPVRMVRGLARAHPAERRPLHGGTAVRRGARTSRSGAACAT